MAERLPNHITDKDLRAAINDLRNGARHRFGKSIRYDVLYENLRYPPKAVVGRAAERVTGRSFGPNDFSAGIGSKCFRILEKNGFSIVAKADFIPLPEELQEGELHIEGAIARICVNKYERDPKARMKSIRLNGCKCLVCGFDFRQVFGEIGAGYIHVHHIVPLADIRTEYIVDPGSDLKPVCPNCHAMLHRKTPPYHIDELKMLRWQILSKA
jgi:5-methylcytosine-specific restriction protein A